MSDSPWFTHKTPHFQGDFPPSKPQLSEACGSTHYVAPEARDLPCRGLDFGVNQMGFWALPNFQKKKLSPSNFKLFFVFFPVPESFHGYMTGIKYLSPIGWELPWPAISCYQPKVLGNSYTLKADLWSLGVISYMLLTGFAASEKRFGWLKYGEKIGSKWLPSGNLT